jgi:hypothetical protein
VHTGCTPRSARAPVQYSGGSSKIMNSRMRLRLPMLAPSARGEAAHTEHALIHARIIPSCSSNSLVACVRLGQDRREGLCDPGWTGICGYARPTAPLTLEGAVHHHRLHLLHLVQALHVEGVAACRAQVHGTQG